MGGGTNGGGTTCAPRPLCQVVDLECTAAVGRDLWVLVTLWDAGVVGAGTPTVGLVADVTVWHSYPAVSCADVSWTRTFWPFTSNSVPPWPKDRLAARISLATQSQWGPISVLSGSGMSRTTFTLSEMPKPASLRRSFRLRISSRAAPSARSSGVTTMSSATAHSPSLARAIPSRRTGRNSTSCDVRRSPSTSIKPSWSMVALSREPSASDSSFLRLFILVPRRGPSVLKFGTHCQSVTSKTISMRSISLTLSSVLSSSSSSASKLVPG